MDKDYVDPEKDYEETRQFLYDLRKEGLEALELAKEVLKESEHPRAIEVYSGLMANVAKVNNQIMELAKINKDMKSRKSYDDPGEGGQVQDKTPSQNFYIGSTEDLQKMLKQAKEDNMRDVTPEGS